GDAPFATVICIERNRLGAVALLEPNLAAGGVLAVAPPKIDRFVAELVANAHDTFFVFPTVNPGVQIAGIVVEAKTPIVRATIESSTRVSVRLAQAKRARSLAIVAVERSAGLAIALVEGN